MNQWPPWKVPEAFIRNAINSAGIFSFREFINFSKSYDRIVHGFHHTSHVVGTGFPSSQQLHSLSLMEEIVGLKDRE
jgi:hypothetical protein